MVIADREAYLCAGLGLRIDLPDVVLGDGDVRSEQQLGNGLPFRTSIISGDRWSGHTSQGSTRHPRATLGCTRSPVQPTGLHPGHRCAAPIPTNRLHRGERAESHVVIEAEHTVMLPGQGRQDVVHRGEATLDRVLAVLMVQISLRRSVRTRWRVRRASRRCGRCSLHRPPRDSMVTILSYLHPFSALRAFPTPSPATAPPCSCWRRRRRFRKGPGGCRSRWSARCHTQRRSPSSSHCEG